MNLRPSNLEQASRPTAIAREVVVPERDAFVRAPASLESTPPARRYSPLGLLTLLVGGVLTLMWGAAVVWVAIRAVSFIFG